MKQISKLFSRSRAAVSKQPPFFHAKPRPRGNAAECSERLIGLYEQSGQDEKLRRELMFRVFECARPELEHITKLKGLAAPAE